jgi:LytS/YehU family sensor histidine kinase
MFYRLNQTFPAIGHDLDLQPADPTRMIMTAVAHPVDTVPVATVTATEAHLVAGTMTMTVAAIVRLQELVAPLMTTLLVDSMTHIAAITLLTHTSMAMADLLQGITLPGIIRQENAGAMLTTILLRVIGKQSHLNYTTSSYLFPCSHAID